jgi:hypothetical protein
MKIILSIHYKNGKQENMTGEQAEMWHYFYLKEKLSKEFIDLIKSVRLKVETDKGLIISDEDITKK